METGWEPLFAIVRLIGTGFPVINSKKIISKPKGKRVLSPLGNATPIATESNGLSAD